MIVVFLTLNFYRGALDRRPVTKASFGSGLISTFISTGCTSFSEISEIVSSILVWSIDFLNNESTLKSDTHSLGCTASTLMTSAASLALLYRLFESKNLSCVR